MADIQKAVFARVEGVLLAKGVRSAAAYFAANAPGLRERVLRLGHIALTAPAYQWLGQTDRVLANRLAYLSLRNLTEDRIAELADEYWSTILRKEVLNDGVELLKRARRDGNRVVLIADSLEQLLQPLAAEIGCVDDYVCNHLEFRSGLATGRLIDPVVGGHDSGVWLSEYAVEAPRSMPSAAASSRIAAALPSPCAARSERPV